MKFPVAVLTTLMLAVASPAWATFFQGFETDTSGWFNATRVATGTHGVPSKAGAFHAEDLNAGSFTRWGGYSKTFPPGGYTTSVDIYLDIARNAQDQELATLARGRASQLSPNTKKR